MRSSLRAIFLFLALCTAGCVPGRLPAEPFVCERDGDCALEDGYRCDRSAAFGRCVKAGTPADAGRPDASAPREDGGDGFDAGSCPWWSCVHRQRVQLRFANTTRGALEGFPVLVVLAPLRFPYASALPDGSDLRFVDDDDQTLLPHEVERWDPAGASYLWVRVPRIEASSDDDHIWLYFDPEPGAPLPPPSTAPVFDADFVGVWHLDEDGADSSVHANHGTLGSSGDSDGQVAGAQEFDLDPAGPIRVPATPSLESITSALTVSAWALRNGNGLGWEAFLARPRGGGIADHYHFGLLQGQFQLWVESQAGAGQVVLGSAETGRWYHVAATWDGLALSLYVDGTLQAVQAAPAAPMAAGDEPLWIGSDSNDGSVTPADLFDGRLDEVRLSRVRRSADFLNAEWATGRDTLVEYGVPEARPAP